MKRLEGLRVDQELLLEFFLNFSCFEFALKLTGYSKPIRTRRREPLAPPVSPDWKKYADSIKDKFDKTINDDLHQASNYLLDDPPREQVLLPNGPSWNTKVPKEDLAEIKRLLILVRRIRNNLFHGGKFDIAPHEQPERTERLLRSSLSILDQCLKLSPDVKEVFDNAII